MQSWSSWGGPRLSMFWDSLGIKYHHDVFLMKDRVQKWMQSLLRQYGTYKPLKLLTTWIVHHYVPNLLAGRVEMSQNSGQCASEAL